MPHSPRPVGRSCTPVLFILGLLPTQTQAVEALAAQDLRAARVLERQVLREAGADRAWALERALRRLRVQAGSTVFENVPAKDSEDGRLRFPSRRPPGVGKQEWRALRSFAAGGGGADGEWGRASYMLLDADGDGLRDLVVRTYNGGTSLVWETAVLRNDGRRFVPVAAHGEGYFESGRGGNEAVSFVRLDGRVYLAYRVGRHGEDRVTLHRPFAPAAPQAWLRVRYRYKMSDPVSDAQDGGTAPAPVAPRLRAAIGEAVARAAGGVRGEGSMCPVPAGVDPEDAAAYAGLPPPPYYVEHIGDAAVWLDGRCFVGQLIGGFGAYSKKGGLGLRFCLRAPDEAVGEERCYLLDATRSLSGMEVGTQSV